jgi:hypothetical protein
VVCRGSVSRSERNVRNNPLLIDLVNDVSASVRANVTDVTVPTIPTTGVHGIENGRLEAT